MSALRRIHVVFAHWCPHCYPLTVEAFQSLSEDLGVELNLLDIDIPEEERQADDLVRRYGDWSEDYLIPQVFFEFDDGTIQHVFTGYSEAVEMTRSRLEALLSSAWLRSITG